MSIVLSEETLAPAMRPDYQGPLRVNGREVWWTGRVAIGLRHEPARNDWPSRSALWLQALFTSPPKGNTP